MAVVVRVTGPEFSNEDSRQAFVRIEEAVRQFSAHSRESLYLVRNPLDLQQDHFVVLWSRGIALTGLWNFEGRIRGSSQGDWIAEAVHDHSIAEINFENPFILLGRARRTLAALCQRTLVGETADETILAKESGGTDRSSDNGAGLESESIAGIRPTPAILSIALFTSAHSELRIDDSFGDKGFTAMSVDYATSRTIFHLPNLLRLADQETIIYSNSDLRTLCEVLEQLALRQSGSRIDGVESEHPVLRLRRSKEHRRHIHWWWVPVIVLPLLILYLILKPTSNPGSTMNPKDQPKNEPPAPMHRYGELVLNMPFEVQLFVSPNVYQSRSDLDYALAHGEGHRFLPSTELDLVIDSSELAKGVYGYFKVDSAWRHGKLLQSFKGVDTISIDNFLPPLE